MVKNVSNVMILGKEEYWEQSEKKKKKKPFELLCTLGGSSPAMSLTGGNQLLDYFW